MEVTGADILVEHIKECTDAQAAIVVDGSADEVIDRMGEAGWLLEERTDYIAGKRIRFLKPPSTRGALWSWVNVHG